MMNLYPSKLNSTNKHFFYKLLLGVSVLLSCFPSAFAQTTLSTTSAFTNNNGSGTVTFNLQNTNSSGIIITDVAGVTGSSGAVNVEMYYNPTPVNGAPGAISAANGWTLVASGTITGVANSTSTTTQTFLSGLNFIVPANTTYGIAIFATGQRYYGTGTTLGATTLSAGGVNFITGPNIGYGGGTPPTAPTNTPRGWIGSITFIPQLPCTSPPTPGAASASASNVCAGSSIQLSLSGNSMGTGQTYQWEGSATPGGPFTAVNTAAATPNLTTNISSTTYYRAAVTCGTSTSYSDTILVTVPPLFPAGTYTIDASQPASTTNFQSFAAAASAINCGISGPVVFNVAAGTYTNDQFLLNTINTTATNTITVNGNGATMSFVSTNTAERAAIRLDGTDHVVVNNLNIVATGSTTSQYGYGIHLTNGADSNSFTNCNITVDTLIASTNYIPVVISGSLSSPTTAGSNSDWNTFSGNTLNGGYYGMVIYGNASAPLISNNTISNNTIKNFYAYGIYLYGNNGAVIEGNDISRPTRTTSTTFAGIIFSGSNTNTSFSKNRIHNAFDMMPTSTSTAYAIYSSSSDATLGNENIISNNLVYNINHTGVIYGIYNSSSDYYKYYHNTISLDDLSSTTTSATRGIYQTSAATGLEFIDNVISIKRGGSGTNHGIYMNTATTTWTANYNNYFVSGTGTNYLGYSGGNQLNLAAWQTATGQDSASYELPPMFTNSASGDYTPGNGSLDNVGMFVGITTDILNAARNTTTPDVGAYEFTVPLCFGTPNSGNATINNNAASATVCPGGDVNLNLQGYSTGFGISIQWESSPVGQNTWTAISGATNPTYNTTMSAPMDYHALVTCSNGGGSMYSNTVTVQTSPFYVCYCSPNTGTTLHTSISNYTTNVTIPGTSLNHSTTAVGPGGYTFADPAIASNTATLAQGVAYTIEVTESSTTANSEVWVDWDQNGVFDATEYYQLVKTGSIASGTITPPLSALTGMTGMRVRTIYSTTVTYGASGACSNPSTGRETQDYVITIAPPPTCFPPTGVAPGSVTATSATFSWTAANPIPATGYDYYYSTTNTNPLNSTTPSGSVSNASTTATISGLTPVTTYYVWVRGNCGPNDYSVWSGPISFTTACVPFVAPYTYDVESQNANTNSVMVNCWTSSPTNSSSTYAWHVTGTGTTSSSLTGPSTAHSGMKYFFTEASYGAANDTAILTTPLVDVSTLTAPMLQFWYHMYGSTINKLLVEVFNGTSWNLVDSIVGQQQTSETAPWNVRNVFLTGYTGMIQARFKGVRGTSFYGDMSIDDISFIQAPSCPAPNALTAAVTTTTANLGWVETGVATQWQVEWGSGTFTQGTGTLVNTNSNPYSLTGLTGGTSYQFYVRSICGANDTSTWSGPLTFATIPPNDTCLNAIDITNGQVYNGTTAGATQTMAPCDATTFANDVWYKFTTGSVSGSVTVSVNTATTGTDIVLSLFDGTCGALNILTPTASSGTGSCLDGPAAGNEYGTYSLAANTTYYVRVYGYNSAQGSFPIQVTGAPLAIKLTSLSATNVASRNRIDWTTESAEDGDYFELERSADGKTFTTIATINSKDQSAAYTYWDASPYEGRNYYRLNLRTPAGGSSYSQVVATVVHAGGSFVVEALPNPVLDKVTVKITGKQADGAVINLTDVGGEVIRVITNVSAETVVDMQGLTSGLYFINYTDGQNSRTVRVTKL
jgi:parallel beta-helix repeat protein